MSAPEVRVVEAWHEALNAGDVERVVEISHPDIGVGGPRGSGQGTQLLREWMARAGVRLEPRRVFHQGDTVIVGQEAGWRSADTGETYGRQAVASVFAVHDDLVVSVSRYADLAEAMRAADLDGPTARLADYETGVSGPGGEDREL
ncbi:MAG: nuclear transport factor 2 family protein [Rubrobacter sp.]